MTGLVRPLRSGWLLRLSSAGFGGLCGLATEQLLWHVLGAQPVSSPALYALYALVGLTGGYVHHRVMLWLLVRSGR